MRQGGETVSRASGVPGRVPRGIMTPAELEALARAQQNPFLAAVQRSGFEVPQSDVPAIHQGQREALGRAVEEVRQTAERGLQVVTGGPGEGKTHLLAVL